MWRVRPLIALAAFALIGAALAAMPGQGQDCAPGIITTVAGSGSVWPDPGSYCGDEVPAGEACLSYPRGLTVGTGGSLFIADGNNHRVHQLLPVVGAVTPDSTIITIAGNGTPGHCGDGGLASEACLNLPCDVASSADGSVYIADSRNHRIRRVKDGVITTAVGTGSPGYCGDGGSAVEACLHSPFGVALGADGSLYIADRDNHRVRKVDPAGIITTAAGNGLPGHSGDGGPATQARLYHPTNVAVAADGSLYIADLDNHRIRKVDPAGIITTVAGNGTPAYGGDGGPATDACLDLPYDVVVGADDSLYIADHRNHRIRKVKDGIITTVAGNGIPAYDGDGGPATEASLHYPYGVTLTGDGNLYMADHNNHRIRKVCLEVCGSPGYEPPCVETGDVVTLHANAHDPCGTAIACEWDFGDGTSASGCDPTHVYATPGLHQARVTATNGEGYSAAFRVQVPVGDAKASLTLDGPCWHMITIPCQPVIADPRSVFRDPTGAGIPIDGNLHRYDHSGQQYVSYRDIAPTEFGTIRPGDGYWLWAFEPTTICCPVICGDGGAQHEYPTSGWYLTGSGVTRDVYLDDTLWRLLGGEPPSPFSSIANLWAQDPLIYWRCSEGRYLNCGLLGTDDDDQLRAYQGYWLYTFLDDVTLEIPPPPAPALWYNVGPCTDPLGPGEGSLPPGMLIWISGHDLVFHHDIEYNCCPDFIRIDFTLEGQVISIYEVTQLTTPCYCICYFPTDATIGPLQDGQYTVNVYDPEGDLIATTEVTVPG